MSGPGGGEPRRRIVVPGAPAEGGLALPGDAGAIEVSPAELATARTVLRVLNQVLPAFEEHLGEQVAAYVDARLRQLEGDLMDALTRGEGVVGAWARELEERLRADLGIVVELEPEGVLPEVRREEDAAKGWGAQDRVAFEYVEEEHTSDGPLAVDPAAGG